MQNAFVFFIITHMPEMVNKIFGFIRIKHGAVIVQTGVNGNKQS